MLTNVYLNASQTETKCLADLCGALHCDFVLSSKKAKSKCNTAAVAKNRHLCEVAFDIICFFHSTSMASYTILLLVYSLFLVYVECCQ